MISFFVPGDPVPHQVVTFRGKFLSARGKRLKVYKEAVRAFAWLAARETGVTIPVPTATNHVYIETIAFFRNQRHADPESIHKVIKDALWPHGGDAGNDKWVGGRYVSPRYASKTQEPGVHVTIGSYQND